MAHLSTNTSGVLKSPSDWLNYTGFPGDVCVAFFNVQPGNKNSVAPNQEKSQKKKVGVFTTVTTSAYQDQLIAGVSKTCEKCKVHGIESFKYVREFYTPVCYCDNISTPLNMTRHKTKCGCQSYGLSGVPWPFKVAKVPRPSAVSLKVWLHETSTPLLEVFSI